MATQLVHVALAQLYETDLSSLSQCTSLRVAQFAMCPGCELFLIECERLYHADQVYPAGLQILDISVMKFNQRSDFTEIISMCYDSLTKLQLTCCALDDEKLFGLDVLEELREIDISNCAMIIEKFGVLRNQISGDALLDFINRHTSLSIWGNAGERRRNTEKQDQDSELITATGFHFGDISYCVPLSSLLDALRVPGPREPMVIEVDSATFEWGHPCSRIPPRLVKINSRTDRAPDGSLILRCDDQVLERPCDTTTEPHTYAPIKLEVSHCLITVEKLSAAETAWLMFFDVAIKCGRVFFMHKIANADAVRFLECLLDIIADETYWCQGFRSRYVMEINQCLKGIWEYMRTKDRDKEPDDELRHSALQTIALSSAWTWSMVLAESLVDLESREREEESPFRRLNSILSDSKIQTLSDSLFLDYYFRAKGLLNCLAVIFQRDRSHPTHSPSAATALCYGSHGFLSTLLRLINACWETDMYYNRDSISSAARNVFFLVSTNLSRTDQPPDAEAITRAAICNIQITGGGGILLPLVCKVARNVDVVLPDDGLNPIFTFLRAHVTEFHSALVAAWIRLDKSYGVDPQQSLIPGFELMRLLSLSSCAVSSAWWGKEAAAQLHRVSFDERHDLVRISCPAAARLLAVIHPSGWGSRQLNQQLIQDVVHQFIENKDTINRTYNKSTRFRYTPEEEIDQEDSAVLLPDEDGENGAIWYPPEDKVSTNFLECLQCSKRRLASES